MKEHLIPLTEKELERIKQVAELRGITEEEAATQLASEAIERRVQRKFNRRPANNVRMFRKGKR